VAHAGLAVALPDARAALLLDAARTVLPPRPSVVARMSIDAERARGNSDSFAQWADPARTTTCRPLVLSGTQLAFLEDLALLRRSRRFHCDEGPSAESLKHAPEAGSMHVRGLLHPKPGRRRAGDGGSVRLGVRERRPSAALRFVGAVRAAAARCVHWVSLALRLRRALGGGSGGP
jgi:hypothetical protein